MKKLTHNDVPEAIEILLEKVNDLEALVKRQKPSEILSDLMDAKEASNFLKISKATLYQKTCKHEIPFRKMDNSNKVLFSRAELTAWLAQGKRAA